VSPARHPAFAVVFDASIREAFSRWKSFAAPVENERSRTRERRTAPVTGVGPFDQHQRARARRRCRPLEPDSTAVLDPCEPSVPVPRR